VHGVRPALEHGEPRAGDQLGELARLPHGDHQVALGADHVRRHLQLAQTLARLVVADGL
ncbi:MAG: hypothetical protein AVDCRST_MAG45-964, partial [uncultured Solirubrobacterales bacterium]